MNSIKKEPARVRPLQVKFWVTEEEKQRIEKRAAKFQSTAAYLREMALKGKIVERPPIHHIRPLFGIKQDWQQHQPTDKTG